MLTRFRLFDRLPSLLLGAALVPILFPAGHAASAPEAGLIGFYVPWDANGQDDLSRHVNDLSVFAPQWISLKSGDGSLNIQPDDKADNIIAKAKHPPKITPVVSNAHDGIWDGAAVEVMVSDARARKTLLDQLATLAAQKNYAGFLFDFEELSVTAIRAMPAFLKEAKAATGTDIAITVPLGSFDWPLKALQDAGATVIVMGYDQCWANSTPGPIAGRDWFASTLKTRLTGVDASKVVVAIGAYAYDWPNGQKAKALSVTDARQLADNFKAKPARTPPVFNSAFAYAAPDGTPHTVWMLDADDFVAERTTALSFGVKTVALWRLGLEDPALWAARNSKVAMNTTPGVPAPVCAPL